MCAHSSTTQLHTRARAHTHTHITSHIPYFLTLVGANLSGAKFADTNAYGSLFDGADLSGVSFENAMLSGASFGKDSRSKEGK